MKNQRFTDGQDVRLILSAMVLDEMVLSRIAANWNDATGLFDSRWANLVGWWCVNHLRKYGKPPKDRIQTIYQKWVETTTADQETVEATGRFLVSLSDVSVVDDKNYVLDLAEGYFCKVLLEKELENAEIEISRGKYRETLDRIRSFPLLSLKPEPYIEPARDPSIWVDALETTRSRSMLDYPGDLGTFFSDIFTRGKLVSFMAPNKTGKTVWLIDAAYRAIRKRHRVFFANLGDGTELDVLERLAKRASQASDFEGFINSPIAFGDDNQPVHESVRVDKVNPIDGFRSFRKACKIGPDAFRLMAFANSSVTVQDLDTLLVRWNQEGWRPDVIVVDYADIFDKPAGCRDAVEAHEENWKRLTRLMNTWNCLLITATQSNAASYSRGDGLLGRQHFSGRRTKLDQVDGMIGINVNDRERATQCCRLNWVVRRRSRNRDKKDWVHVAGCYDIENPAIISKW